MKTINIENMMMSTLSPKVLRVQHPHIFIGKNMLNK